MPQMGLMGLIGLMGRSSMVTPTQRFEDEDDDEYENDYEVAARRYADTY